MFFNSVSGPKQYEFSKDGWEQYAPTGVRRERRGENTQFFQVIEVDGGTLRYAAYIADGQLYDAFGLEKSASGTKTLVPSAAPLPVERSFDNTMPYPKN